MAGLLDPSQGDGTYVENRPTKWQRTLGILNEYNPIDAFWRLYDSDMAKGGPVTDSNIEDAMTVTGMVTGGSALAPKPRNALNMGIRAYHGSPHDFDRFDMSKIGTGEGAQAYGHGLYFAENEAVARGYRDQLSRDVFYDGNPVASVHPMDNPQAGAIHSVAKAVADGIPAEQAMAFEAGQWRAWADPYLRAAQENPQLAAEAARRAQSMTDIASAIEALDPQKFVKNPGRMYEVQINADPEQFLDWDKPLSEQPEAVRKAIGLNLPDYKIRNIAGTPHAFANDRMIEVSDPSLTGRDAYILSRMGQSGSLTTEQARAATKKLREQGIPGIKYLDAGSRGAGDGTRNYVVFDDNLINILRKYGIAGLLGTGAAGNAMLDQPQEVQ